MAWDVLLPELLKCDLLCANCHQMEHSNRHDQKWLDEAAKYQGKTLGTIAQSVRASG